MNLKKSVELIDFRTIQEDMDFIFSGFISSDRMEEVDKKELLRLHDQFAAVKTFMHSFEIQALKESPELIAY